MKPPLTPIYLAGRLIGYRDANREHFRVGTIASSPFVTEKAGELKVTGGDPETNKKLVEIAQEARDAKGQGIPDEEGQEEPKIIEV